MKQACPLCDKQMDSFKDKTFHYWCDNCNHGWYIADLKNFIGMCLKDRKEEARQIILKADKE